MVEYQFAHNFQISVFPGARIWIKSSETLSKDARTFLLGKHA